MILEISFPFFHIFSFPICLVMDPTFILDDDCTSCNDVDECDATVVAKNCYNHVNCGDPGILLGISNRILQ